jgi:predicted ATPase
MIKSVTFTENYELSLEKEEQKRWGTKTYQPTRYTREKKPWTMFKLFKKGLRIDFNEGVNVIVGENGSGKSTLFHLIKNYAGTAPDKLSRALSDCKTDDDFVKLHREHYHGELEVDGDISFKNTVFFDAEKDNPIIAIPQMITPSNMPSMASQLWDAQEESHGESMKPILEYLLTNAKGGVLFFDEPDTALSLSNQFWLVKQMIESSVTNQNQIIISTHALAIINQFPTVFDMEARKWVNREIYVNTFLK